LLFKILCGGILGPRQYIADIGKGTSFNGIDKYGFGVFSGILGGRD